MSSMNRDIMSNQGKSIIIVFFVNSRMNLAKLVSDYNPVTFSKVYRYMTFAKRDDFININKNKSTCIHLLKIND